MRKFWVGSLVVLFLACSARADDKELGAEKKPARKKNAQRSKCSTLLSLAARSVELSASVASEFSELSVGERSSGFQSERRKLALTQAKVSAIVGVARQTQASLSTLREMIGEVLESSLGADFQEALNIAHISLLRNKPISDYIRDLKQVSLEYQRLGSDRISGFSSAPKMIPLKVSEALIVEGIKGSDLEADFSNTYHALFTAFPKADFGAMIAVLQLSQQFGVQPSRVLENALRWSKFSGIHQKALGFGVTAQSPIYPKLGEALAFEQIRLAAKENIEDFKFEIIKLVASSQFNDWSSMAMFLRHALAAQGIRIDTEAVAIPLTNTSDEAEVIEVHADVN